MRNRSLRPSAYLGNFVVKYSSHILYHKVQWKELWVLEDFMSSKTVIKQKTQKEKVG